MNCGRSCGVLWKTFVPESFQYIYDSVVFMIENDVKYIACNYAYEPYYSIEDAKVLFE